ncbi:MAG TPA: DUF1043 family protein [Trueperaceae bacterium]
METWIWVVIALLVGIAVGGAGVYLYARRRWADAARAEELQRELDGYRQEVSDHFVQTAGLVNDLTRSYKAVYDHLEQGAYRLVDEETLRKQLGDVEAETVRLEFIGRRNRAAVLGPSNGPTAPREDPEQAAGWVTSSTEADPAEWGRADTSAGSGSDEGRDDRADDQVGDKDDDQDYGPAEDWGHGPAEDRDGDRAYDQAEDQAGDQAGGRTDEKAARMDGRSD